MPRTNVGKMEHHRLRKPRNSKVEALRKLGIVAPSSPLSMYFSGLDVDGTVMRYMLPADGTLEDVAIHVEKLTENDASLIISVQSGIEILTLSFPIEQGDNVITVNANLLFRDRITMRIQKSDTTPIPPAAISGIWVAAMLKTDVSIDQVIMPPEV